MTVEEYRQRLIEVFHNTDNDQYIALVALPNDNAFRALESLLNNIKKKDNG